MLTVASAQAAPVVYTFVGETLAQPGFPSETVSFQLTVPGFVQPIMDGDYVSFSCAQTDWSINCRPNDPTAIGFRNDSIWGAVLSFDDSSGAGDGFIFPAGSFEATGVYSAVLGTTGTLTVSEVPEANSVLLVLDGTWFFGLLLRLRTRR
jgi:hypothetical protein